MVSTALVGTVMPIGNGLNRAMPTVLGGSGVLWLTIGIVKVALA